MASELELLTELTPKGDQPEAIDQLLQGLAGGDQHQVLLGITGSGKTFTVANVIATTKRPTLIIAPNKTLAAQLYGEMRELFPNNAVEYFVSYYDYYQPEAYIPSSDTYIEKDAIINDKVDRMRHSATRSLLSRRDVIIVASVSCIYGLGSPENYRELSVTIERGGTIERDAMLRALATIQYRRDNYEFAPGRFRVRGDVVEVRDVVTGAPCVMPLAGPANRQGRVAADAIFGRDTRFRGVQGTAVCGAFELVVATKAVAAAHGAGAQGPTGSCHGG